MAFDPDEDEDDFDAEGYFSDVSDEDYTGKNPKFFKTPELDIPPADLSNSTVEELITMYRAIRDQLATDRKGYKTREARMKTQLSIISMILRDKGDQAGVDSFGTPAGTAFRAKKETFTISDWEAFVQYIKNTGYFHIIQKRVSPNAIKEVRTNDGDLPPGVACLTEVEFSVRSPTARKR